MPCLYILLCSDGSYYTGSTWNLERRMQEHRQGTPRLRSATGSRPPSQISSVGGAEAPGSRSLSEAEANGSRSPSGSGSPSGVEGFPGALYTSARLPVELVYCEECDRIEDAFRRGKQIQGWSRKKKEALMMSDTNALHRLAEGRNETHFRGFDSAQPPASSRTPRSLTGSDLRF